VLAVIHVFEKVTS